MRPETAGTTVAAVERKESGSEAVIRLRTDRRNAFAWAKAAMAKSRRKYCTESGATRSGILPNFWSIRQLWHVIESLALLRERAHNSSESRQLCFGRESEVEPCPWLAP
jgi:hypothetical protein